MDETFESDVVLECPECGTTRGVLSGYVGDAVASFQCARCGVTTEIELAEDGPLFDTREEAAGER